MTQAHKRFSVGVHPDIYSALETLASAEMRTVSNYVSLVVAHHVGKEISDDRMAFIDLVTIK